MREEEEGVAGSFLCLLHDVPTMEVRSQRSHKSLVLLLRYIPTSLTPRGRRREGSLVLLEKGGRELGVGGGGREEEGVGKQLADHYFQHSTSHRSLGGGGRAGSAVDFLLMIAF